MSKKPGADRKQPEDKKKEKDNSFASALSSAAKNALAAYTVKLAIAGLVSAFALIGVARSRSRAGKSTGRVDAGPGKTTERLMLASSHTMWLAAMKRKYNLPDVSKALRIVVTYAQSDGKSQIPNVLAGRNAALEASGRKQEVLEVQLRNSQLAWVKSVTPGHRDVSFTTRALLDWVISGAVSEAQLFTVVRPCDGGKGKPAYGQ